MSNSLNESALKQLQAGLRGRLIKRGDPDYDDARKILQRDDR